MLTENQLNALAERAYQRINAVNTDYLISVGETLKKIGELRPSDVHKLQQMYDYGMRADNLVRELAKASEKNVAEIYDIFNIVAQENYDFAKPFYKAKGIPHVPYAENKKLNDYVHALAKQTVGEYMNLTQHTAFAVFAKDGKTIAPLFAANKDKMATSLSDTYTKVVDYAVQKVQLGLTDYNSAIKELTKALADSGIKTVDYATGYFRRLDTSVRQNVLWGIKQCNQNVADLVGEEFGADGYEISYHSHPRPSHAEMGGRQYARGKARTINGVYYPSFEEEAEPLLNEYNCLHFKFPILLGISRASYSESQLAEFKAEDTKTFEFEGRKYTKYEGTQLQRRMETAVRNHKDLANIAKAAGDDDLRREAQYKINLLTDKYAKLADASGLPTKRERMDVRGFRSVKANRTIEGQAKYKAIVNRKVDQKQYERYIGVLGADRMPKTIDEFQKMKYTNVNKWNTIKQEYRIVNQYKIDSGEVSVQTILDMDRTIIKEKRNNFPSAYKTSGNIAGAYVDTDKTLYIAHSQINEASNKGYKNYKGDANVVLLQQERSFRYIDVLKSDGSLREKTFYDTEAKLFEEFHLLLQTHPFNEITMLSERGMCESCIGIMEQFKKAHPNVRINAVSNKKVDSNVWKYRLRK